MENMKLKKVEELINEIYDNIVSQATPAMYVRGEFEDLVNKCFDERYNDIAELIENFEDEEKVAYLDIVENCAKRYEKRLTDKFFNCFSNLERD